MASKRAIRRRACDGKQAYPDQPAAVRFLIALHRDKPERAGAHTYRCSFCHQWHVGHPPAFVKRAMNA